MKSPRSAVFSLVAIGLLLQLLPALSYAKDTATVDVSVPLQSFRNYRHVLRNEAATPPPLALVVTVTGRDAPVVLPISADTYLVKGKNEPVGDAELLVFQDGRTMVLLQPDLSPLAGVKPDEIRDAALSFTVGWKQRDGAATFSAYRMLTAWTEAATWDSPRADASWAGPKAGVDFEKEPLSSVKAPAMKAGPIQIPALADVVKHWIAGDWPKDGLLLQMTGSVGQANVLSSERVDRDNAAAEAAGPPSVFVGDASGLAIAVLDTPLVQRAVLSPADIAGAELRVKVISKVSPKPFEVEVRYLDADTAKLTEVDPTTANKSAPVATVTATIKPGGDPWIAIPLSGDVVRRAIAAPSNGAFLLTLAGEGSPLVEMGSAKPKISTAAPALTLAIARHPNEVLFSPPLSPRDGVFTRVKDGHFDYGGQRLRLWGVTMTPRPNPEMADRLRKMGFNSVRLWGPSQFYDKDAISADPGKHVKGDGSKTDQFDQLFAAMKAQGFFIDFTGLMDSAPVSTADGSWLTSIGGNDWPAWQEAYTQKKLDPLIPSLGAAFDERLMEARKRHIANVLNYTNPYTGTKYGQEECIALYELGNERAYVKRLLEKGIDAWPQYFREKLQRKWDDWLTKQYGDDAKLSAAWGSLAAGESIASGSVTLSPTISQRDKFPAARGRDFIRFVCDLVNAMNHELEAYARTQSPDKTGVAVVPFSYDTQFQPSVPWLYTTTQGDVANFGMYFWTLTSALTAPPSMYVMDSHTVEGKPTVIYETNASRPNPYRAEFPVRLAAIAGWQDWDGVFFHFFSGQQGPSPIPDEQYAVAPTKYMTPAFGWTAVEFETDPALLSSMAAAGQIFLRGLIAPAPDPVTYVIGKDALFSFETFKGLDMTRATFSRGARIRFDADKEGKVSIQGVDAAVLQQRLRDAVAMGDSVTWDWPHGRLIIDNPAVKAYVGKPDGLFKFKDGIVVGEFEGPFVCFVMVSADGKPLVGEGSRKVFICSTADAKNTGFAMDSSVARPDGMFTDPLAQANAIRSLGQAPVVSDPVSFKLWWPRQWQGKVLSYDFALRQSDDRALASNELTQAGAPSWIKVLQIDSQGAPAKVPDVKVEVATAATESGSQPLVAKTGNAALDDVWNPLPRVDWADGYLRTRQLLQDGSFLVARISDEDRTKAVDKVITLSGAVILADAPADIEVRFHNDAMTRIDVTFTRPPALQELIAATEKQFGPATQKSIAESADKTSTVRWQGLKTGMDIDLRETQGTLSISYTLTRK